MRHATGTEHTALSPPASAAILRHRKELLAFLAWQRTPRDAGRRLERLARTLLRAANQDSRRDT